jgi:transglutaminase-like putative cysteine protease
MSRIDATGVADSPERKRVVTCDLSFTVTEQAEIVLQVAAADSAGCVMSERFDVALNGTPAQSLAELRNPAGERMHVIEAEPGELTVSYRSELNAPAQPEPNATHLSSPDVETAASMAYERQVYLRPSRYVPSDHLIGFAVAEFGITSDPASRATAIAQWINQRISYVPGSSDVHDSAEDTLLTGMGTCRDFAHLGIALCRGTGIPARFAAVYAPGLSPMEFHAVFETLHNGHWLVRDATRLVPRQALVRIATGRDAADVAYSAIHGGAADPGSTAVSATVGGTLPVDDFESDVVLA